MNERWIARIASGLVIAATVVGVVVFMLGPNLGWFYHEGEKGEGLLSFSGAWVQGGENCGALAQIQVQGQRLYIMDNETLREFGRAHLARVWWHETRGPLLLYVYPCAGYVVERMEVFS